MMCVFSIHIFIVLVGLIYIVTFLYNLTLARVGRAEGYCNRSACLSVGKIYSYSYSSQIAVCRLQFIGCSSQIADRSLQFTDGRLQFTDCRSQFAITQIADCSSQVADCCLQFSRLQFTDCSLQVAVHRLQFTGNFS